MIYCITCKKFFSDISHNHADSSKDQLVNFSTNRKYLQKEKVKPAEAEYQFCSFCNEKKMTVSIKQIRGLDEAPTIFETCYGCKKTRKID